MKQCKDCRYIVVETQENPKRDIPKEIRFSCQLHKISCFNARLKENYCGDAGNNFEKSGLFGLKTIYDKKRLIMNDKKRTILFFIGVWINIVVFHLMPNKIIGFPILFIGCLLIWLNFSSFLRFMISQK